MASNNWLFATSSTLACLSSFVGLPDVALPSELELSFAECVSENSDGNFEFFDDRFASFLGQQQTKRKVSVWSNAYAGAARTHGGMRAVGTLNNAGGIEYEYYVDDKKANFLPLDPTFSGVQVGVDRYFSNMRCGLYYNYGHTNAKDYFDINRWKTDNHLFGASLVKHNAKTYFIFLCNAGYDHHEVPKIADVQLNGKSHGFQTGLYSEVGLNLVLRFYGTKVMALKPFTGFYYSYLYAGDISNAPNIHLQNSNQALYWLAGVHGIQRFGSLEYHFRFAAITQLLNGSAISTHFFSPTGGTLTPTQFIAFNSPAHFHFWEGVGFKWYIKNTNLRTFVDVDGLFGSSPSAICSFGLSWVR